MKQQMYMEHANITVNDLKEAMRFFKTAFPHFEIRGGGNKMREWIHFGDEDTYIAINQALDDKSSNVKNYDSAGINHIGFVVSNVAEIARRLLAAGYKRDYPRQVEEFRIREYFTDTDGNEYEFVEYLSDKAAERNLYD